MIKTVNSMLQDRKNNELNSVERGNKEWYKKKKVDDSEPVQHRVLEIFIFS